MTKLNLQVYSETGRLRQVLLHKPGQELNNLTPSIMKRLLFDDIPDAKGAAYEYNCFLDILHQAQVETVFVEDLLVEALEAGGQRSAFLHNYLSLSEVKGQVKEHLERYFSDLPDCRSMVEGLIKGLRKEEAPEGRYDLYGDLGGKDNPLILDPLPNLYFTRDPFIILGEGVSISKMFYPSRRRETLFARSIFEYHPAFQNKTPIYRQSQGESYIEGGDILILNEEIIAIGLSQRTNLQAIKTLAESLFQNESETCLRHVLAFRIPATRAFMHLDTVFTMLDERSFVVHSAIEESLAITDFYWEKGSLRGEELSGSLRTILQRYLKRDDIRLIKCGGGSPIDAEREQWNDGSNTLALAPGEIIVYDRNHVTNELLAEAGFILHKLPCSEISRGRGGPHCMSMPLNREHILR